MQSRHLLALFLVIFIDSFGFGLVIPIMGTPADRTKPSIFPRSKSRNA